MGFPGGSDGKESACHAGDLGLTPGEGNGNWSTPVFLLGEAHGRRSLAGYSPWGFKEGETAGQLAL